MLRIEQLETMVLGEFPNVVLVLLQTDDGLIGLGETSFGVPEIVTYLHSAVAPRVLGRNASEIEAIRVDMKGPRLQGLGSSGTGVEVRAASAIDIALWDLFGKAVGRPIYDLFGGACRRAIRAYNTCAGYALPGRSNVERRSPYEDADAWQRGGAGDLARDLLEHGITGMKMWPFDDFARKTGGTSISAADVSLGLEPFRQVWQAVGNRMDLLVELHGLWNLSAALDIATAFEMEGIQPFWIEDPILPDDIASLARFAQQTRSRTAASELLGGRHSFRQLLEARAADVVLLEPCWCGGLSEGRAIATLADAFGRPIALHDGTGPVGWAAGVQLAMHVPNALIQETVRSFHTGWYADLVANLPRVENGLVYPPSGPGLGVELRPGIRARPDADIRVSR
jgi:L-alanine-DL-glutamate epimerase-like enolase superfamily enzyme